MRTLRTFVLSAFATFAILSPARPADAHDLPARRDTFPLPVRGITIGPIENTLHPAIGYGTPAFVETLDYCKSLGANWIALTPFGRVANLSGRGVDPTFETPFEENRAAIVQSIHAAHAKGLAVMLVPHLWVESGEWRALIDPKTDEGWRRWIASYRTYVLGWARVAEETHTELLSMGVELRSWVTSGHAPMFVDLIREVRSVYHGSLTYSANWDDAEDTVVWGDLDWIGINAFFPLAYREGATDHELREGGERVRIRVQALERSWKKRVLFTEMGYTTIRDPAVKPWEWPDHMKHPEVSERDQARAYAGLLEPNVPSLSGFFVWRIYSAMFDATQEARWGFSPQGKLSERVLRDAYRIDYRVPVAIEMQ